MVRFDFRKTYNLIFNGYWFQVGMILIALIYLFFPNNNHLSDSIDYGASVKYGIDMFSPHHLLYVSFNRVIYILLGHFSSSIDALKLMQFVNGIFAVFSLLILRKILESQTGDIQKSNTWTLFVACSFGVMRFSVEAETYIIPIFFSLLSSKFFLEYLTNKKTLNLLFCGLFASVSCLFHQIHLFWGIGLFIGLITNGHFKKSFIFLIPTPLVLIVYSLVMVYYQQIDFSFINLYHYLADYYYSSKADVTFGASNFYITFITFFRTFFQIHGLILDVLRLIPLLYLIIPFVLILIGYSIFKFIKSVRLKFQLSGKTFELTHLLIFTLQLSFAVFSHGNSEFMVMLPFLIPVFIYLFFDFNLLVIKTLTIAMLIWNLSFSTLPNHIFDYQNNLALIKEINHNPEKIFVLKERNMVVNRYFYEYGKVEYDRLIAYENLNQISTNNNKVIYTDVLSKKSPYSRVDFTSSQNYDNLLLIRHVTRIKSSLHDFYIDEVKIKN